ncbi:dipeptide epimerase [Halalkalibacterium halodurans]|uniref:dipeptide epimerase n=1 Tax=Halalkalibacterium halodurans TaxID=86665 RepID=UPI002E1B61D8|nr:dipeptide epimerase [Halalkalibacterium halodurans]
MNIRTFSIHEQTYALKEPFVTALRTVTEIEVIHVIITLESGAIGRGSAAPTFPITGESKESMIAAINGPIMTALMARSMSFQEALQTVQNSCAGNTSAKAAVDIALHHAYAQSLGISLLQLLGGASIPLENDMTVSLDEKIAMEQQMLRHLNHGFQTVKIKVGTNGVEDLERILHLSHSAEKGVIFRIDANQAWSPKEAVQFIRQLEAQAVPVQFVEQPVKAHDLEGLRYVRDHVATPIMADESCTTRTAALRIIQAQAADMLNIKLMKCGGLNEARVIADLAQAADLPCMIGSMMESSWSVAAAAALASTHPNITMVDLDAPLWLMEEPPSPHLLYEKGTVFYHEPPSPVKAPSSLNN